MSASREQAIQNLPSPVEKRENNTVHGLENTEIRQLRGLVRCRDNCPVIDDCSFYDSAQGHPCPPNSDYVMIVRGNIEKKMRNVEGGGVEGIDYELILDNAMFNIGMLFQMYKWMYVYGAVIKKGKGTIMAQPLLENGIEKMQRAVERSLKVLGLPRRVIKEATDLSDIETMWQGK